MVERTSALETPRSSPSHPDALGIASPSFARLPKRIPPHSLHTPDGFVEPCLGLPFAAMPRILQLTDSISRLGGGVTESLRGLTRELVRAGTMEVSLAAGEDASTAEDQIHFDHLEHRTFPVRAIGPVKLSREAKPLFRRVPAFRDSSARRLGTGEPGVGRIPPERTALDRLAARYVGTLGDASWALETAHCLAIVGRCRSPGRRLSSRLVSGGMAQHPGARIGEPGDDYSQRS